MKFRTRDAWANSSRELWFALGVVASIRARMNCPHTQVIYADKPSDILWNGCVVYQRAVVNVESMVEFDRNFLWADTVSFLAPLGYTVALLPEGIEIEFSMKKWSSLVSVSDLETTTKGGQ